MDSRNTSPFRELNTLWLILTFIFFSGCAPALDGAALIPTLAHLPSQTPYGTRMFIPTPSATFVDLDNSPYLTRPAIATYTPAPEITVIDRASTRVAVNISFQNLSDSEQMRHVIIEGAAEVLDANLKIPDGIGRLRTVDVIKRTLAFVVEYSGGESIAQPVDDQIAVMLCALRDNGIGGNMNIGVSASLNWEAGGTWSIRKFCFTPDAIRALNCLEPQNTRLDDLPQGVCSSRP